MNLELLKSFIDYLLGKYEKTITISKLSKETDDYFTNCPLAVDDYLNIYCILSENGLKITEP